MALRLFKICLVVSLCPLYAVCVLDGRSENLRAESLPFPALPALNDAALHDGQTLQSIHTTMDTVVQRGVWREYLEALDSALSRAFSTEIPYLRESRYQHLAENPLLANLLAQAAFIRAVSPENIKQFAFSMKKQSFLRVLMDQTGLLEELSTALRPEDNRTGVLEICERIHNAYPDDWTPYANVALACALVHDESGKLDPIDRFLLFIDSDKKGLLKTDIKELPVHDLIWVVDCPLSPEEIRWAQEHVNYRRSEWGQAYRRIRYRMDKAVSGIDPYEAYTLPEIEKAGGTCGDQAYFASMSAKANGIPAMVIVGAGQRGAHAWFGFKASSTEWDMDTGRYDGDEYAAGTAVDPQTKKTLNEHELQRMADPQVRSKGWMLADRYVRLGHCFMVSSNYPEACAAFNLALSEANRHEDAWYSLFECLHGMPGDKDRSLNLLQRYRQAFRAYPDKRVEADRMELELAEKSDGASMAAEIARRQTQRMLSRDDDRTDLVVRGYLKQAALLDEAGDVEGALKVFRDALSEMGHEVVPFKIISQNYYEYARLQGQAGKAVAYIHRIFKKRLDKTGDFFWMNAQVELVFMIADMYKQDGQIRKAQRMLDDFGGDR